VNKKCPDSVVHPDSVDTCRWTGRVCLLETYLAECTQFNYIQELEKEVESYKSIGFNLVSSNREVIEKKVN
jgi:hypothetical protein